jgi:hypothetical protein
MKSFYLAQIEGQLFGLDKDCVAGVGVRNDTKLKPQQKNGRKVLPLANGAEAVICDLQSFLAQGRRVQPRQEYSLIIKHEDRFMALTMTGRGRLVMMDEKDARMLPPAFSDRSRRLLQGVLINCADLVFLLDLDALMELPEHAISQ